MMKQRQAYSICSRPEVSDDVIFSYFSGLPTMLWICELASSVVFKKFVISHLRNALTTVRPFGPIFGVKKQKYLITYNAANKAL